MIAVAVAEPQDAIEPVPISPPDDQDPPASLPSDVARLPVDTTDETPSRRRGTWLLAIAAAVVVLVIGIVLARGGSGDDGPAGRDLATSTSAPRHTTTTAGSSIGGVQPGVDYDVHGVANTSPSLDTALADSGAVFAPLGGTSSSLPSTATLQLQRTPATLRYEAYNAAPNAGCKAFLSRPVTITGTWGRLVVPKPGVLASVTVVNLQKRAQADEAFVSFSLGQGPTRSECSGFNVGGSGVADYLKLDVRHQDPQLDGLPEDLRYNVWLSPAGPQYPQYSYGLAGVIQRNRTVVLFGFVTKDPPDVKAATQVLNNVLDRI
jgi:hypothetical protein